MNAIVTFVLGMVLTGLPLAAADSSHAGASLRMKSLDFERQAITADVAHYSLTLPVGPGEHDKIRVHRVVKESAPWVPIRTSRAILLAHGDAWGFEPTFLASLAAPAIPDTQALAVFLAEDDVDVWGVDFRWALVPGDVPDRSFMGPWGLGTSVDDLDAALTVARTVRFATGNGLSKLLLLGWSRGTQVGYALLSAETERPRALRNVRGFVAMDVTFKTDDLALRQSGCDDYAAYEDFLANGFYVSGYAVLGEIGDLAAASPDDDSPFFPGVTNADLAELIGADVAGGSIPYWHSVGGVIDPATFETELLYTRPEHWFAFMSGASAYEPLRINLDGAAILCDEIDSPYDDHLAEITVPVFYVGAAGAYGELGVYTTTLLGSSDVTTLIVNEASQPELDWGHSDLFLAEGAEDLVWWPILDWINAR